MAEERIARSVALPGLRQHFLDEAANWLAKSEANLDSAFDESPEQELGAIRLEQAKTEETIARFMEMSGGDSARRLSNARRYREESFEILAKRRVDG